MSFIAAAVIGSAAIGAFSSNKASKAQTGAAGEANRLSQAQYEQNRADMEPWRKAGGAALDRLSSGMGLTRGASTATAGFIPREQFDEDAYLAANPDVAKAGMGGYDHYLKHGISERRDGYMLGAPTGGEGDLTRKFTEADFNADPVTKLSFQYGLDQGNKSISNMASARGMRDSGATIKAMTRFGTDYGGQQAGASRDRFIGDQTNLYNRLAGISGSGQQQSQVGAAMGAQNASTIGQNLMGAGNARGAAAIGQGNAFSSGLNTISNWYGQNAMLDKIIGAKTNGGFAF